MSALRPARSRLAAALLLAACQHEAGSVRAPERASPPDSVVAAPAGAGQVGVDAGIRELDVLSARLEAAQSAREQALWTSWTTGAPLDLSRSPRAATREVLATLRRLKSAAAPAEQRRLVHLERHVLGELLASELREDNATIASLEASATFSLDGKEHAFRELTRLLVHEKSAVKRRALWAQARQAAQRLDAAVAHRNLAAREVLAGLEVTSALELAAEIRDLDLDALGKAAQDFLRLTDEAWAAVLSRRAREELRLKPATLTRADLPRLLRPPEAVEAALPKERASERLRAALRLPGLPGEAGLTLELDDSPRRSPLPLTVAPTPGSVRVSLRPLGGIRDLDAALAELGHALAVRHVTAPGWEWSRLGDPGLSHVSGELLSSLLQEPAFLVDLGLDASRAPAVAQAAREGRLHALRREAAALLARLESAGLPDAEARARALSWSEAALKVKHEPADAVRVRIDGDEDLRSASTFRAALLAENLRARLVTEHGREWWRRPDAARTLEATWAPGTSRPAEDQFGRAADGLQALVGRLTGGDGDRSAVPTAPPGGPVDAHQEQDAGPGQPPDAGTP